MKTHQSSPAAQEQKHGSENLLSLEMQNLGNNNETPFFCTNIGPCLKPAFSYTKGYRAQANSANFREPIDAMKGCHLGS
jgi:hypothetical protein